MNVKNYAVAKSKSVLTPNAIKLLTTWYRYVDSRIKILLTPFPPGWKDLEYVVLAVCGLAAARYSYLILSGLFPQERTGLHIALLIVFAGGVVRSLHNSPVLRAKIGRTPFINGISAAVGAIGLTIMGDSVFDFLTYPSWDPSRGLLWRVLLILAVFLLACWKLDDALALIRNLVIVDPGNETLGTDFDKPKTPDAFIVFVSDQEPYTIDQMKAYTGGFPRPPVFQSSIQKLFIDRKDKLPTKKRHVYLLHSGTSKTHAEKYVELWEDATKSDFQIHVDDYQAAFESIKACHDLCTRAIRDARELPDVNSVAIDITGGTKPTSSAAVLAGLDHDVNLYYIEQAPPGDIKGIDVTWRKRRAPAP